MVVNSVETPRLKENCHNKEDAFIEHLLWGGGGGGGRASPFARFHLTLATAFVNEVSLRTIALSQMRKQSL